jgi:hypothetical protein
MSRSFDAAATPAWSVKSGWICASLARTGTLSGAMPEVTTVTAVAPLRRSSQGGSGSFLVRADDGQRYWCKTLNNAQHPRVPINEYLVARLGHAIGVAVCEPRLVEIPTALVGWEFRPGLLLAEGCAYGGRAIEAAIETRALDHRSSVDNAVRQAGFYALHDWLGGSDPQWLYASADGNRYYSHDHGHYFWGPAWTIGSLTAQIATPAPLGMPPTGLNAGEIDRLATRLEGLGREEMRAAMSNVPPSWPIEGAELDAVLDFVVQRCQPVAQRLRAMPL